MGFLLTRPLRDVTDSSGIRCLCYRISTHTPLAGRDGFQLMLDLGETEFLLTRPLRDVTLQTTSALLTG